MVDGGGMAGVIRKNKTILIVEDNELNMKLFHDLLEAHGYATLQTKDGNEALKLAREHRPNLILMDIQLRAGSRATMASAIFP
jgi:two-component system, cell cycle response regulator DivK